METLKRPPIPSHFYKPSSLGALGQIVSAFALCLVPALLARAVFLSSLPLVLKILLTIPLMGLAGHGALLIGWVGHEGAAHFSLHKHKLVSILLGMFVASSIPAFFELGFAVSHWNHHRFTNQASDPDCQVFSKYKTIWGKLLFARLDADWVYTKNWFLMAFNKPLPYHYRFPYQGRALTLLAWANLGFVMLWTTLYAVIILYHPLIAIFAIALPTVAVYIISSVRPYLEHAGTEATLGRDSRSMISPLFTLLYGGNNYHLEHHLYPGVPGYHLPAVHELLKQQGFYQKTQSLIEPSFLKAYAQAFSLPYPEAGQQDSDFDPLIPVSTSQA